MQANDNPTKHTTHCEDVTISLDDNMPTYQRNYENQLSPSTKLHLVRENWAIYVFSCVCVRVDR